MVWEKSLGFYAAQQNYYISLLNIDAATAIDGFEKILHKRSKLYLKNEQDIELNEEHKLYAMGCIANGYFILGKTFDALKMASDVYFTFVDRFGITDTRTQESMSNLNRILFELREYDTIIDLLENTFLIWKEKLPNDSEIILNMKYVLGIAYGACNRADEGERLLRELYQFSYDRFGMSDKQTLRYRKEYAICVAQEGNHQDAIEILLDCKDVYERVYGLDKSEQLRNIIFSLFEEYIIIGEVSLADAEKTHLINMGYSN